jgi:hypothetical protein
LNTGRLATYVMDIADAEITMTITMTSQRLGILVEHTRHHCQGGEPNIQYLTSAFIAFPGFRLGLSSSEAPDVTLRGWSRRGKLGRERNEKTWKVSMFLAQFWNRHRTKE